MVKRVLLLLTQEVDFQKCFLKIILENEFCYFAIPKELADDDGRRSRNQFKNSRIS